MFSTPPLTAIVSDRVLVKIAFAGVRKSLRDTPCHRPPFIATNQPQPWGRAEAAVDQADSGMNVGSDTYHRPLTKTRDYTLHRLR